MIRRWCRRLHIAWLQLQVTAALAAADWYVLDDHPCAGLWMGDALDRAYRLVDRIQALQEAQP